MKQSTKQETFRSNFRKFLNSVKNQDDYFNFCIAVWSATRQGDGLVFTEIREVINVEMLKDKAVEIRNVEVADENLKCSDGAGNNGLVV